MSGSLPAAAAAPKPIGAPPGTGRQGAPSASSGLGYGFLGLPLAFAALPLYVQVPDHYARVLGAPLAGLGLVLLAVRLIDAGLDPWLGKLADGALNGPVQRRRAWLAVAALVLAAGLWAVFQPPLALLPDTPAALLAWCGVALLITGLGHSALTVLHQAWATRLGGDATQQARWAAWREALALAGVLVASALPTLAGVAALPITAALLLGVGVLLLGSGLAPAPLAQPSRAASPAEAQAQADRWLPWRSSPFRRLIAVQVLNGVASAVPASLVLFFIRDRLQAPQLEAAFLVAYFVAAGCAVPIWIRVARRLGLVRTWLAAMGIACTGFVWAAGLGPGDHWAYALVCIASGSALGADLVAPAALLTGIVQREGHADAHEGRYVGWWAAVAKLNLAFGAGLALPLLQAAGYRPGDGAGDSGLALALAYAALPCVLKLAAAALLWQQRHHLEPAR